MTFNLLTKTHGKTFSNQSLNLTGFDTAINRISYSGLSRSRASQIVGFDNITGFSTGNSRFNLSVNLCQLGLSEGTAIGMKNSFIDLGNASEDSFTDNVNIEASVYSTGGRAFASALQDSYVSVGPSNDSISIRAEIEGCYSKGSLAIAMERSFVGGNTGDDHIEVYASGRNSIAARRSRIFGGPGNDKMVIDTDSSGFVAEDTFIWGRQGDDDILIGGPLQYTGKFEDLNEGGGRISYEACSGGEGTDTLRLPYMTTQRFLSEFKFVPGLPRINDFTLASSPGMFYLSFEKFVLSNGSFTIQEMNQIFPQQPVT